MRTKLMLATFTVFFMGSSAAYGVEFNSYGANISNDSQVDMLDVSCAVAASAAVGLMEVHLKGELRIPDDGDNYEAEKYDAVSPPLVAEKVYSQDIADISLDSYQDEYYQGCMNES